MSKAIKTIRFILIAGALQASQAYAQPTAGGAASSERGVESSVTHKTRDEVKRDIAESRQNATHSEALKRLYKGH
jgi:hypothetical protein